MISRLLVFPLDATAWPHAAARTMADRQYVYSGSETGLGSPVAVGHPYSLLAWAPERNTSWAPPVSIHRVPAVCARPATAPRRIPVLYSPRFSPCFIVSRTLRPCARRPAGLPSKAHLSVCRMRTARWRSGNAGNQASRSSPSLDGSPKHPITSFREEKPPTVAGLRDFTPNCIGHKLAIEPSCSTRLNWNHSPTTFQLEDTCPEFGPWT